MPFALSHIGFFILKFKRMKGNMGKKTDSHKKFGNGIKSLKSHKKL